MATPWTSESEREEYLKRQAEQDKPVFREYIDRDQAIKLAIYGADEWDGGYNRERDNIIMKAIKRIPSADVVEVKHGEWRMVKYPLTECTSCYIVRNCEHEKGWNYCPNCGADMRGGK